MDDDRDNEDRVKLEPRRRELTAAEKRLLRARIHDLDGRVKRAPRVLIPGVAVILLLYVLTLLASDTNGLIVTGFWAVMGAMILVWVLTGTRKDTRTFAGIAAAYRSALEKNEALAYDVRSTAFAELEEIEDEGACYAFQIEEDRMVFLSGQQLYPEAKFPSHDFSIVQVLDERDNVVAEHIEKRGPRVEASEFVPAFVKARLEIPDDLEVLDGLIEDIERLLRKPDPSESA